jgi:hypothetical protein
MHSYHLLCLLHLRLPSLAFIQSRYEDAPSSLSRLRTPADTANGYCVAEIQTIREALHGDTHRGSWFDLFNRENLRRTMIVIVY